MPRVITPEGREAHRRAGRRAVESGQLLAAARLGGKKQGPINGRKNLNCIRELPQTKVAQSEAGKRTVQQLNDVPANIRKDRAKTAGKIGGAANVESGHLARAREHCDYPRQARWRSHLCWHVNGVTRRGIWHPPQYNSECNFCNGKDSGYPR